MEVVLRHPKRREAGGLRHLREADHLEKPIGRAVGRVLVDDGEGAETHGVSTGLE